MQKPSIGRIIIYTCPEIGQMPLPPRKIPGIITSVNDDDTVNLQVFSATGDGSRLVRNSKQGDDSLQWNWPIIQK